MIDLLISEPDQLPGRERKASKRAQRDCLALWLRVLDEVKPGLDTAEAEITLGAALTVVDHAVRTGRLSRCPDLADWLAEIGSALLLSHWLPLGTAGYRA
ncbi:hypothetical protein [Streptomyces sp. NPDC058424]|uniref:hypothetical protein n=1 Tax=Streptomyces sp. NPDC058424 TaxID=3346491 RepID=UPI00365F748C